MKTKLMIALFAIAVSTTNVAHAQLRKIPAEVTNSFAQKFPNATNVEWKDQLVDFKVAFDVNDKKYEAKFSNKGEWKVSIQEISVDKLPKKVVNGFSKSEYAQWEIKSVAFVQMPRKNNQYKITVAKNELNKKDLLFSPDGQLLKDSFTF